MTREKTPEQAEAWKAEEKWLCNDKQTHHWVKIYDFDESNEDKKILLKM